MLKIIGRTYNNLDIFEVETKIGVCDDGSIVHYEQHAFIDTVYLYPFKLTAQTTKEHVKNHLINLYELSVDGFIVDILNRRIDGEEYEEIDEEDDDFVFVSFRGASAKLYDNESDDIVASHNDYDNIRLQAIIKALDFQVDVYETFENLDFKKDDLDYI